MRKFKPILAYIFIIVSADTFGQDCDKLLQGGLYSFTKMTNTGSFSKDLRTYYLSEQFKTDMKSGKWGGSVTIPIEGVPFSLGLNFSDDQYNDFRSKLLATTELKVSENFYQTTFGSIPNVNLYEAYVKCVGIVNDVNKTGFIQGVNIETDDFVAFNFYYRPQAPGDAMPLVSSFNVQPEGSIVNGGISAGQTLNSFSFVVTCKRDPDKDLVLSLQTNRGTFVSKSSAEGSFSTNREMPLGTIVTSVLNFEQFSFVSKNNEKSPGGIWTSNKSKWAPCDGRPLPNSKYSKVSSRTNAPDFRGIFLRGLNSFDPTYTIQPTIPSQLNPDNTPAGVYQQDEFKSHTHGVTDHSNRFAYKKPGMGIQSNKGDEVQFDKPNISINSSGGNETRPKNVSVFYYIKIN